MVEKRKLAAILAADVVGFSRLTGVDEDRTLARLRALRSDLIDPTISAASYGQLGRVDEAREGWREALRVNPNYSLEQRRKVLPYKNPADFELVVDGLRKAGLVD
jgi:adenylate cyclase